jgi:hypothetical protein
MFRRFTAGSRAFALLLLCVLLACAQQLHGQGLRVDFGKNVVQYKDFEWYYYHTKNFDAYYYSGGRELALYTVTEGERFLKEVETRLDFPLGKKITFVIYNSYSDFRQSNFRIGEEETNPAGRTRIQENKVFIYFNGDHFDFASQIKGGISKVIMNDLLYGGNIQERIQSNVLLNAPSWYISGLVEYMGDEWNPIYESRLKNGILSGKFRSFKKLSDQDATLIGHSLWKYINDTYGETSLANIVYIMRANKSIETGYMFVLGKSFDDVFKEWYQYEYNHFKQKSGNPPIGEELTGLKKVFKKGIVTHWDISQHGDYAAVVVNDMGKDKLFVVNLTTGKKKMIYKMGYRRAGTEFDYNYPLIAWNTREDKLTVFIEKKSIPTYFIYDVATKKKTKKQIVERVDRIQSLEYSDDGHHAVMSVVRKGQTDIAVFDFRTQRINLLTDDIYDDLDPHFVHEGRGIIFTTNRPSASLAHVTAGNGFTFNNNYDIYYFPTWSYNHIIKQLSKGKANEINGCDYDSAYFGYITDENGIYNRNAVRLDSVYLYTQVVAQYKDTTIKKNDTFNFYKRPIYIPKSILADKNLDRVDTNRIYKDSLFTYPITDYNENLYYYRVKHKANAMYEFFQFNGKYYLYKEPIPHNMRAEVVTRGKGANYTIKAPLKIQPDMPPAAPTPLPAESVPDTLKKQPVLNDTTKKDTSKAIAQEVPATTQQQQAKKDSAAKAANEPYFQSDFPLPKVEPLTEEQKALGATTPQQQQQAENPFFMGKQKKQKLAAPAPYLLYFNPDQVVTQLDNGQILTPYEPYDPNNPTVYPPTLNGMFKLGLSDLFKDYRIIGGMRILGNLQGADYFLSLENYKKRLDKRFMFFREGQLLTEDGTTYYRNTINEFLSEFRYPLSETQSIRFTGLGRVDKRIYTASDASTFNTPDANTYWLADRGEYVLDNTIKRGMNLYNGTRMKFYAENYNGINTHSFMVNIGADIRHYQKIHRQIIWANRFATGTSLGTAKVVYFLGGVDNWISPVYNQQNLVDPSQNYVFKTQATQMRGFVQNVRNGNAYAVINSELRIPLFQYIFNRPLRSNFFQNFQVVGFTDIGSAWEGFNPIDSKNNYTTRIINAPPFQITVVNKRDPIVYGYGFGFRSTILGYYLKLDYAWGVEDGVRNNPVTYISMGYDF